MDAGSRSADIITTWATAFAGAHLYFANPTRTAWEDHELRSDVREAEIGFAQHRAGVRKLRGSPPQFPAPQSLDGPSAAGSHYSTRQHLHRRYGTARTARWAAAAAKDPEAARSRWNYAIADLDEAGERYEAELRAIKAAHDPLDQLSDYTLGRTEYREAVEAATLRHFPPLPPPPPRKGPTPREEDAAMERQTAAREEASLRYADLEINGIFAGGPFAVPVRAGGGERSEQIAGHAGSIAATWLVLSNPRQSDLLASKKTRDRDKTYAQLGLCKALVKYPDLLRSEVVEVVVQPTPLAHMGPDSAVNPAFERSTYEVSYTRNEGFRAKFDQFVAALVSIKQLYDPEDRLRDYRLGRAEYRQAVEACVGEYFPPRVSALALLDELKEWRGRVHNRIVGPCRQLDPGDHLLCVNKARYFADVADDLELDDAPPIPTAQASYEDLRTYFTGLIKCCERRVEADAQRQQAALVSSEGNAAGPTGKRSKADWKRLRKDRDHRAWVFLAGHPGATAQDVADHCGCGKSYVVTLTAWMAIMAKREKLGAENKAAAPPSTVSFTSSMEAIASRDNDPTEEASAECAAPAPVKLHRAAGRAKRLEGQKIRQQVHDEIDDT